MCPNEDPNEQQTHEPTVRAPGLTEDRHGVNEDRQIGSCYDDGQATKLRASAHTDPPAYRQEHGADPKLGQIRVFGEGEEPDRPEWVVRVVENLTEFWNHPMMPTLTPDRGKPIRGPEEMVMALMQAEVSDQTVEQLLTADEVAVRLKVSRDWVWDHSSRRLPYLPVIRMSDGALRYRASQIDAFLDEREQAGQMRRKRR